VHGAIGQSIGLSRLGGSLKSEDPSPPEARSRELAEFERPPAVHADEGHAQDWTESSFVTNETGIALHSTSLRPDTPLVAQGRVH
jgi:hypothetical protein